LLVTFWGTRGSIATPGRLTEKYGGNTPCVSVVHDHTHIILDAGTGIRQLGLSYEEQFEKKNTVFPLHLFLSHTHWDHIQGLPFFDLAYQKDARINIYGSYHKERLLESILKGQMDVNYFPVSFSEMAADIRIQQVSENPVTLDRIRVEWQEQIFHPGGSVRYGLNAAGKRIVYATDVELDRIFRIGFDEPERKRHLREYLEFVAGADLLIADGQYTDDEYKKKAGWGHTSMPVILDLAKEAGIKQLAVFHHEPRHSDKDLDRYWKDAQRRLDESNSALNVFWAREGMTVAV